MAEGREEAAGKLQYWIMGGLLSVAMAGLGWYTKTLDSQLKTLEQRIEAYSQRELARAETLTQTSGARWERLSVLETRVVSMEPRLGSVDSRVNAFESRLPLVESKATASDSRLQRIEDKLDALIRSRTSR